MQKSISKQSLMKEHHQRMSIHRQRKEGNDESSGGNSSPENMIRYSQSVEPPNLEFHENNNARSNIVKPRPDKVGLSK